MYELTAPLILASASPRRSELLSDCGIRFQVYATKLDEKVLEGEEPQDMVLRLSQAKAQAGAAEFPDAFILAADTDVALGSKIFGKPQNVAEALSMLKELSDQTHQVLGGISLFDTKIKKFYSALSITSVTFRKLSTDEMHAYVRTKEPYDKAGGYAAQGLGASFIKIIQGSYTNVVGLDLSVVLRLFREAGILKVL